MLETLNDNSMKHVVLALQALRVDLPACSEVTPTATNIQAPNFHSSGCDNEQP